MAFDAKLESEMPSLIGMLFVCATLFHGVDTVFKFLTKAHQLLRLNPLFSSFCPCGGILVSHSVSPAQVGNHHIGHGGDAISITLTKVTSEYSRDHGRFPPA